VTDARDVDALNELQVVNAGEHLYFSDAVKESYIKRLVQNAKPHIKGERGMATIGPALIAGKPHGEIVHTRRVDVQTKLRVQCIERLPSATKFLSTDPRVRGRQPDLLDALDAFHREVMRGQRRPDQFTDFLKDRIQAAG
jgi:hypothetical protein